MSNSRSTGTFCNRHLTDGAIPAAALQAFRHMVGQRFWTEAAEEFLVTDIGTRVFVAVRITADMNADRSWLHGSPMVLN